MASNKDLNRVKVVLAEKKSNLWLSKQLGCTPMNYIEVVHELIVTTAINTDEDV